MGASTLFIAVAHFCKSEPSADLQNHLIIPIFRRGVPRFGELRINKIRGSKLAPQYPTATELAKKLTSRQISRIT